MNLAKVLEIVYHVHVAVLIKMFMVNKALIVKEVVVYFSVFSQPRSATKLYTLLTGDKRKINHDAPPYNPSAIYYLFIYLFYLFNISLYTVKNHQVI